MTSVRTCVYTHVLGTLLLAAAICGAAVGAARPAAATAAGPTNLTTEMLTNPIGIDARQPRLGWLNPSWLTGHPSAYQVQLATTADFGAIVWDSGEVAENAAAAPVSQASYAGTTQLVSAGRYYWHVKVWDANGTVSDWSASAYFQMGLLNDAAWAGAQWIQASTTTNYAPPEFRHAFTLTAPPGAGIARATLTVAAGGFADAYLNGSKVSTAKMNPANTQYDMRMLYSSYDVTTMLDPNGANVVGAIVGGGWYDPAVKDAWSSQTAPWVAQEKLRARLQIIWSNATATNVVTNNTWTWHTGEITWSSFRGGEDVDHNEATPDWTSPPIPASDPWNLVTVPAGFTGPPLQAMQMPSEQVGDAVPATPVNPWPSDWVADTTSTPAKTPFQTWRLNANTAMDLAVLLEGDPRSKVQVQVGEGLTNTALKEVWPRWNNLDCKTGTNCTTKNWQDDRWQRMDLTLSGDPSGETFETTFTYLAGTYVEIKLVNGSLAARPTFTARTVHTALTQTGSVSTSDSTLNSLHSAAVNTYLNNLHGYPSDCPTRERMGYGADAMVASIIGIDNFSDAATLYEKWMADFAAVQADPNGPDDGFINWLAPAPHIKQDPTFYSPWWSNAAVHIPLELYEMTGDITLLRSQAPVVARYVAWLHAEAPTGEWTTGGFDPDHESADATDSQAEAGPGGDDTDANVWNTLAIIQVYGDAMTIYQILDDASDLELTQPYAVTAVDNFNNKWLWGIPNGYARTQTPWSPDTPGEAFVPASAGILAEVLDLGIVPAYAADDVLAELVDQIHQPTVEAGYASQPDHINTGILGTYALFRVLADRGLDDLAVTLLSQSDYPTVLGGVEMQGSVPPEGTIWERTRNAALSHDHPAFGSVDQFLYRGIGGIDLDHLFMENTIVFQPGVPSGMTSASVSQPTPLGAVSSSWNASVDSAGVRTTTYSFSWPVGTNVQVSLATPPGAVVTWHNMQAPPSGPNNWVPGHTLYVIGTNTNTATVTVVS